MFRPLPVPGIAGTLESVAANCMMEVMPLSTDIVGEITPLKLVRRCEHGKGDKLGVPVFDGVTVGVGKLDGVGVGDVEAEAV